MQWRDVAPRASGLRPDMPERPPCGGLSLGKGCLVQAAAGRRPAAVASSRMPGSMCCSAIDEMPSRMKRVGLSVRSKKRSPGSMMTLRAAAASARLARVGAARAFEPERGAAGRIRRAPFGQEGRDRLHQPLAPLVEGGRQPAHQRLVMAERQEQRDGALVVGRRVAQHEAAQRAEFGDQAGRGDDVAEPQARRERLRHRADIDDAARAVDALQRLLRRFVEKLAVIAVLDDDLVVAAGAREQILPALVGQRHHGRAVVARRHEDEAGIGGDRRRHDALLVDRRRHGFGAGEPEDRARVGIAGILHRDLGTLGHQEVGEHVERVLRAERHDDLVRIGEDAAPGQEPRLDLLDQQRVVAVDHVGRPVADFEHGERHAVAFAPFGGREQRRVELAVDEGVGRLDPVAVLGRRRHVGGRDLAARLPVDLVGVVVAPCGWACAGVASTSGLTKWPRRSRATRKPWSTSCWKASTTVPRATPSFSARMRQEGSGMEAAIWRSRIAATIAWRICACKVCPDSAEMRNSPDHIAASFRCGMAALLA